MFSCGRCNFAVETEEVIKTHCLENHGVNHVNNYFKVGFNNRMTSTQRGTKSKEKKVTGDETIIKLASKGHRGTKPDVEREEELVVEVETPKPSKTSPKRGAKKEPGNETITKLAFRCHKGIEADIEPEEESVVEVEVETPSQSKASTKREAKSKAKKVPGDETITKLAPRGHRGNKTDVEPEEKSVVEVKVETPKSPKTSNKKGPKYKAKKVPGDETITKLASRGHIGTKADVEPAEESVVEVETPKPSETSTKRGPKYKAMKVPREETITKLASRGHRGTKAVVEVEVKTPQPSKTSAKSEDKSKAKKVPGDETITKLAQRGHRGTKADVDPGEESAVEGEVKTPNPSKSSIKRGSKSKSKKVPGDETITKFVSRGHKGTKADVEPEEESVEVKTPEPSKTSTKSEAKSKAKKVPGDETITKLAPRGHRGTKANVEPEEESAVEVEVESPKPAKTSTKRGASRNQTATGRGLKTRGQTLCKICGLRYNNRERPDECKCGHSLLKTICKEELNAFLLHDLIFSVREHKSGIGKRVIVDMGQKVCFATECLEVRPHYDEKSKFRCVHVKACETEDILFAKEIKVEVTNLRKFILNDETYNSVMSESVDGVLSCFLLPNDNLAMRSFLPASHECPTQIIHVDFKKLKCPLRKCSKSPGYHFLVKTQRMCLHILVCKVIAEENQIMPNIKSSVVSSEMFSKSKTAEFVLDKIISLIPAHLETEIEETWLQKSFLFQTSVGENQDITAFSVRTCSVCDRIVKKRKK